MKLPHDAAPAAIVAACAGVRRPVVVVDGGSGAGKSSLAAAVAHAWTHPLPLQVVSLDELYPGWTGLAAASRALPGLLTGARSGYLRWDWQRHAPAGRGRLDPDRALLVEGCGSLTPPVATLATLTVWMDLDADTRRARAHARDAGRFDPYWDLWATQERLHWRSHRPWELADLLVAGPGAEP